MELISVADAELNVESENTLDLKFLVLPSVLVRLMLLF